MDSLPTGSDELLYIKTNKVIVTIKGQASHPKAYGGEVLQKESRLKICCDDEYEFRLKGEQEAALGHAVGNTYLGEYITVPIFYEQQNYEIVIESIGDEIAEFWHDNYHLRNRITQVGSNKKILSGIINFGNEIGMSDFVIRIRGAEYLRITLEVFPSKISYKEDYKAIVEDVTTEIYNIIFDLLKKTYGEYKQNDKVGSSPVEFFAILYKIYADFINAADIVLNRPHHELKVKHEVLPNHKIKSTDIHSLRWLEKHPNCVSRSNEKFVADRALAVKKEVTYDTKENRFIKYILQSTAEKLKAFKENYICLQRQTDQSFINKMDEMIQGISRRCNSGFLLDVNAQGALSGMSLVFSMAPGYRDVYKYYLMLLRGLSITGDIFRVSIKDMALLYEYWCFIKLNSLLRNNPKYILKSQDIVKAQGNGIYVSLVQGKPSTVKYQHQTTQETIELSYNPKETNVPTITQKPDNVLTLEKKGTGTQQYEYVFDAKYRINPALPGTNYYTSIGKTPGPEIDDINTMHRYRDAIVYRNGASPFERVMFGAYVLFPYSNEEEYRNHRFFKSIEKVNIGGLPFLPSATSMVADLLDQLIADSPASAFERAILPRGIETKLAKVDWSVRDVLIGTMRDKKQFEVCLHEHFYYIPADKIGDDKFPIHYVALYQSKNIFGTEAGVRVYGEVTKCACVQRKDITEIPARLGTERRLYYRFEIKKWMYLESPILPKEMRFVKSFTNLFLLESSTEMPELWIRSEEEYRLYYELKRSVRNIAISENSEDVGFNFNNCSIIFDNQTIRLRGKNGTTKNYSISEFMKRPNAVFRQIKKDILLLEENAPMESDIKIR